MQPNRISIQRRRVNNNEANEKLYRSQLKENDILFSIAGALGRTTIICNAILPANTNQALAIIRLKENSNLSVKYANLALRSWYIQSEIDFLKVGLAQPNLSLSQINEFKIPLPPKEIQAKIVAEIEKIEKREQEATKIIVNSNSKIERLFSNSYQAAKKQFRLSDSDKFSISIGKRVVAYELVSDGDIPVYSANVFEPVGNIDKTLIDDFSSPSILWGIDGDWMVNCMPENRPFYPTDHCGVLRILDGNFMPKYVAWILHKEGKDIGFSRQLRASIDRIAGLSIKVPSFAEQQKIVAEVELLEKQIAEAQKIIDSSSEFKNAVLKKYL